MGERADSALPYGVAKLLSNISVNVHIKTKSFKTNSNDRKLQPLSFETSKSTNKPSFLKFDPKLH